MKHLSLKVFSVGRKSGQSLTGVVGERCRAWKKDIVVILLPVLPYVFVLLILLKQFDMNFLCSFFSYENSFVTPFEFYTIPTNPYINPPVLLFDSSPNTSQKQDKLNFILNGSAQTRESLQQEPCQKPKNLGKKRVVRKDRDQNFGWRNQNKDRNIMSNILKAFFNYLLNQFNSINCVQETFEKLSIQTGVSAFYDFIQLNFPLNKSYVSPRQLKTFLHDPTQPPALLMVLKLVLVRFLRLDFTMLLLKSTKTKRRSQLEQMKKARELIDILFRT